VTRRGSANVQSGRPESRENWDTFFAGNAGSRSSASLERARPSQAAQQMTPEEQLKKYLQSQSSSSLNDRKVIFKDLMLKYHPDKNQDKAAEATEMFQFLQRQKTWFLAQNK
jgi:hypothetical protein